MPTKSNKDNSRVFDVAKPGSAQADATSRPIIVGHKAMAQDPMMAKEASSAPAVKEPELKTTRGAGLVIQPVHETENQEIPVAISQNKVESKPEEGTEAPSEPDTVEAQPPPTTMPETPVESAAKDAPTPTVLAETAKANKEAAEESARQEAIVKLIENKQYALPIGEAKHGSTTQRLAVIVLVLLLLLILAGNFLLDAELIDAPFEPLTNFLG